MGKLNTTKVPFWLVKRGDSLWNIAKQAYGVSSNAAIAEKVNYILKLNPFIKDPNVIHPNVFLTLGQISPGPSFPANTSDLTEASAELCRTPAKERDLLYDYWEVLSVIAREFNGQGTGVKTLPGPPAGYDTTMAKHIKRAISAANSTAKEAIKGQFGNLLRTPAQAFRVVEGEIQKGLSDGIRYVKQTNGALGLIPSTARGVAQNGRVVIANPSHGSFRFLSESVRKLKWVAKNVLGPLGYVSKGLDFGFAGYNIYDKWGTPEQNRTVFKETGKLGGSLTGGLIAAGSAKTVCGVLTLTTGGGGLACYFVVIGGSSLASSWVGGKIGEAVYELAGEAVKAAKVHTSSPHMHQVLYMSRIPLLHGW